MELRGRSARATVVRDCVAVRSVGLNLDLYFCSFFQLHLVAVLIGQLVWDANLAVEMVCAFHRDLGFFRLAGTGMRVNHFLDLAWKSGSSLTVFQ